MIFKLFGRKKEESVPQVSKESPSVEKDLEKLIYDLENNGMRNLVGQMSNDNIYSDFLIEKRKTEISSTDLISWYAYRRSDKLNSEADKNELLDLLALNESTDLKTHTYRCLACICANTNNKELFDFLITRIQIEDDDSISASILSRFREVKKDETYDLALIKRLVSEGTYHVSHAAIKALSYAKDPEVEDLLLYEFKIADKHMKAMICRPLGTVGSVKSIPALKDVYKKTRDQFLRLAIETAIHEIENR